jgi:Ca2+-transporting ATPase
MNAGAPSGLTTAQALERGRLEGPNELPGSDAHGWLTLIGKIISEPMFVLLVGCGGLYWALGDPHEAWMLLGFVVFIMGISLYQDRKTEHALQALRDMSSPRALVVRDGEMRRIAGREVVRDDVLVLTEGDRVAADAVVLTQQQLLVDESLLTGESIAVRKCAADEPLQGVPDRPGGDDVPFVWAGTLIVGGHGLARVTAIGAHTEMGRIGKALRTVQPKPGSLQLEMAGLVRWLTVVGLALCLFTALTYGVSRGDWLGGALVGLTLAMAILPNELPVVLTIFLALGTWRISKHHVLAREVAAVEALGAATALCVDKTGTLTLNRMQVAAVETGDAAWESAQADMPETCGGLLETALLATRSQPVDPLDQAIVEVAARAGVARPALPPVVEFPMSPPLLAVGSVWAQPDGTYRVAMKGAPEAVISLCSLDETTRQKLLERASELAAAGWRMLGVASARVDHSLQRLDDCRQYEWQGFMSFSDPLRPGVKEALAECYEAGIRVLMITGDHPLTARAIGRAIGLRHADAPVTGPELAACDDETLRNMLADTDVFCRVLPEQKLRLVQALQARGDIVVMTGDGVNDAPALRAAHIGIAMGKRGSDVARESATMVVLDDDFTSIVHAIRQGRGVYDNLKRAMAYLFGIHLPIVGLSVLPVLLGWPLILLPVHIAFLHLIIDPACSIVFEAEPVSSDVMRRPPRDVSARLFNDRVVQLGLLQGVAMTLIVAVVFSVALWRGQGELDARALTFTSLVCANVGLIWSSRSARRPLHELVTRPNPALWYVSLGTLLFLGLVLCLQPLRAMFHFSYLHGLDIAFCIATAALGVGVFEWLKKARDPVQSMRR